MKPKPKTNRQRRLGVPKILKPREFEALLRNATPQTLPAFVLGGFCGLRQSEICRIDWPAINFKRKYITVNASITKTARRRLVPLHDAAAAWLAPVAKESGRVIEYSSAINLCIMMRPVWKKAGVKPTQNCLRHSAASYALAVTGNAAQTALDLGTSVQMLMQNYRELVTKEDAEVWFSIFPQTHTPPIEGDAGNPSANEIPQASNLPSVVQEKLDNCITNQPNQ